MQINGIKIHDLHFEDLQNPHHPSSFEAFENYALLVIRLPEHLSSKARSLSYGFILTSTHIYQYDPASADLIPFEDGMDGFYRFLDSKIDRLMKEIEGMSEKIIHLEESLYKKFTSSFMDRWHHLKKELSRSERVIIKAVDTLKLFIDKSKYADSFPHNEFNDLYEHIERTLRSNIAANDQLDNLYHYYNLRSSDRLNRSIYILTVISVIFLPLNLVVGFFGMNTGGLPFEHSPMGTAYAFACMIFFALALTVAVLWKIKAE